MSKEKLSCRSAHTEKTGLQRPALHHENTGYQHEISTTLALELHKGRYTCYSHGQTGIFIATPSVQPQVLSEAIIQR